MGSDYFLNPPPPLRNPGPRLYDEYMVGTDGPIFDDLRDAKAFVKLTKPRWSGKPKIMHRVVSHWREVTR